MATQPRFLTDIEKNIARGLQAQTEITHGKVHTHIAELLRARKCVFKVELILRENITKQDINVLWG